MGETRETGIAAVETKNTADNTGVNTNTNSINVTAAEEFEKSKNAFENTIGIKNSKKESDIETTYPNGEDTNRNTLTNTASSTPATSSKSKSVQDSNGTSKSVGSVADYFERYLEEPSLFSNKKVLLSNYQPDTIEYREKEVKSLAQVLAPSLRLEKPSNVFIYGKTGTGKTLTALHTTSHLAKIASERTIPLRIAYVNCKLKRVADTEYRLIAEVCRTLGKAIPPTGLPTDEVYNIFHRTVDSSEQILLLILDEIDQLIGKAGDEILYNLTRINTSLSHAQVSLIGISNDVRFIDYLDPRIKSSLSEEEFVFPPYNAIQLQGILRERTEQAFAPGVLESGVIEKCAAIAAREHGDARRAIELVRVAGELAERQGANSIAFEHLDKAEETIERDRIVDTVKTQPTQYQATLYAILLLNERRESCIFTGDIYDCYSALCKQIHLRPLTQRRISDIIAEFDMTGIINAKIISKGRYGRTREISLTIPDETKIKVRTILQEGLSI